VGHDFLGSGTVYGSDESFTTYSVPSETGAPSTSGAAQDGATLTAQAGSWNGIPAPSYAYQWERCSATGASCTAISGATSGTYALGDSDVGHELRVVVTATNAAG
jgi:hypothetical protein